MDTALLPGSSCAVLFSLGLRGAGLFSGGWHG